MEFLRTHKKAYMVTAVIVCIILIIVTIMYRTAPTLIGNVLGYIVAPLQKGVTNGSNFVSEKIQFLNNLEEIGEENRRLRERVEELQAEVSRLHQVDAYNEKLSDLLDIDRKYSNYPKVGAQIIAVDPGNWYNAFLIDKGTNAGFTRNMVVLARGSLVGRILEAGTVYSKVVSLIDESSSVPAQTARTGDTGVVRGDASLMLEGLCRMDYIDLAAEILEGDEIVTSNLSNIYPPGIAIGHVKEIHANANGLTKYAIITPTVDFKHLETVLVINQTFENKLAEVTE